MQGRLSLFGLFLLHIVNAEPPAHKFGDTQEVHDKEHLKQHFENKIDVQEMTEEQQKFHYFFMHDTNKDSVIDGIEILKAMTHNHDEDKGPAVNLPIQDENQLAGMIDSVLRDVDLNDDGVISFAEYRAKQEPNAPPPQMV